MADVSALLGLVLAMPLAGAVAAVLWRSRGRLVARAVGAVAAAGWVVLVAATSGPAPQVVELGRLTVDPLAAAAVVGLAVLVATAPPATPSGTSAALTSIAVLAAAATAGAPPLPDRPLAAGLVALAGLAAVRFRAERVPLRGSLVALAGAALTAGGLLADDAEVAAVTVLGGATVVALAVTWSALPGRLLLPAVLLAVGRVTEAAATGGVADLDRVALAGVSVGVVGAVGLAVGRGRGRVVAHRLALGGLLAALVLRAVDVAELRRAAVLAGAGALLALAARHPVGLVAVLPGLAAAVDAAGLLTGPEQVAAGAAALLVLAAGAVGSRRGARATGDGAATGRPGWAVAPAVVFGLVPSWGWADVGIDRYVEAVVAVAAAGVPVLVLAMIPSARRARRRAGVPTAEPTATAGSTTTAEPAAGGDPPPPAGAPPDTSDRPASRRRARGQLLARPPAAASERGRRGGRLVARRNGSVATPDGIAHPDE